MPVRRQDTQRALRLLEDYRAKLSPRGDRQLRTSVERVIGIFRSSLFQALLDIQEFYEAALLENPKSADPPPKPAEAAQPGSTWEVPRPPSTGPTSETSPSSRTANTQKFGSQDEDSFPSEPSSFPQAPGAGMPAPELVHVSQRSLSQLESVRGFVGHSHISPAKVRAKKLQESVGAPGVAGGLFGPGQKPLAVGGRRWEAAAARIVAGGKQCRSHLTPSSLLSYLPDLCFTVKV
ncbi:disks large 1 [Crotalus adamanteus]|uniref:Disks large 1 n=1 Tax=Crotalus adamanteus TaxID=8729 RepID=A0AAW1BH63_CROAD